MATVTIPAHPYTLEDWLKQPCLAKLGEPYDKYMYADGESLQSIADAVSRPWKQLTGQELSGFNYGTAVPSEVNYYLERLNGCKRERNKNYVLSGGDTQPFVWVPRFVEKFVVSPYRSPSKEYVGHVGLDDGSGKHINTLVIRPTYVVTLQLGDMDALYDCDPSGAVTVKGRQQRLQALGYLYRPLKHAKIADAYNGVWAFYAKVHTEKGQPTPKALELDAVLKTEIRNNIIAHGFPTSGQVLSRGRLPVENSTAAIRLPGGYMYNHDPSYPRQDNDANYQHFLTDDRHKIEDEIWKANDLMGKIPLVATVRRVRPDGKVEPAEGVAVYFQLIKPDALDQASEFRAPDLGDKVLDQTIDHRPPANQDKPNAFFLKDGGPKKFVDTVLAPSADDKDPQQKNCPSKSGNVEVGGKRDLPVAGNIFEIGVTRVGLHSRRSPRHADYGDMRAAEEVKPAGDLHKHAVCAFTNEKGNAGVIFMPSRIGGDTYKLRAYVGPPTIEFDGTDKNGPVFTTGTLVVWRNIRLHRYLQMKVGARRPNNVSNDVRTMFSHSDIYNNYSATDAWRDGNLNSDVADAHITTQEPETPASLDYFVNEPKRRYRPIAIRFPSFRDQLRRAWCELIVDAGQVPEAMTDDELGKAVAKGITALKDRAGVGAIDWDKLIFHDFTSPFLINVRSYEEYNAIKGNGKIAIDSTNQGRVASAIGDLMVPVIMNHFSGGGVLPGLTLVQVPSSSTWAVLNSEGEPIPSGIATHARGAYLNYTQEVQKDLAYSVTANASHELGHVLVRQHAPDTGNTTAQADCHQDKADAVCVMSYTGCLGEYCGRCVMALRGARVRNSDSGAVTYEAL